MKKIKTLFKKNPENLGLVINEIDPNNMWVYESGIPTQKFDGTACAIIEGNLYKRYDVKVNKKTGKRKPIPENAIPCQNPDEITGHWPHWVLCDRNNPSDKYYFEAFDKKLINFWPDGTYELIGEKVQGNPEKIKGHLLIKHGSIILTNLWDYSFESIKKYFSDPKNNIEGIVFYEKNGERMCKIRKSDFEIKR